MKGSLRQIVTLTLFSLAATSLAQNVSNPNVIPKECAKEISTDTGHPLMFLERNGLIFGISAKPFNFADDPISIVLWIDNPSDKTLSAMTCSDIGYFWREAMDVFDSSGHRVRSKGEIEQERLGHSDWIDICGRNFGIEISPHSCQHSTFSAPLNDLSRDLRSNYDLAPGRYFIVPSARTPQHRPVERTVINPKVGLTIDIQATK